MDKHFVIGINAVNDINPSQSFELEGDEGEKYPVDSFDFFFKNPENAKSVYYDIFYDVKRIIKEKESTKFSVFSHKSNADKIRLGQSNEFKIYVTIKEGDDELEYNLGSLYSLEELEENLGKLGLDDKGIDLTTFGLKGIEESEKGNGYIRLFNNGVGGGTHNISSSIISFSSIIKSKWFKIISPDMVDDTREYTSRTSLFMVDKDGEKFCSRTNANQEQLDIVYNEVLDHKEKISDILVTTNKGLHIEGIRKHSVPTNFDENVLHDVLTVVFNCEDREMGVVINAVIHEAENFIKENDLSVKTTNTLSNLLESLNFFKTKLSTHNLIMFNKNSEKKDIINRIQEYVEIGTAEEELGNQNSNLKLLKNQITDLGNKRLTVLKEILISLIEITKITESNIEQEPDKNGLGRVVIITDGEDGSVGAIESNNHEVFFTNTIWNIGSYEKKFFKVLTGLSKGEIDLNIMDTTGCGDSSTAAALMIREASGLATRKEHFIQIFKEIGVPEELYDRSIAIVEAYFLSHFQEVISGVVYHCKKSNLGDINNSKKINNLILGYVFTNTLTFIREGMDNFTYGNDSSIVIDDRIYNGFYVNKISELG